MIIKMATMEMEKHFHKQSVFFVVGFMFLVQIGSALLYYGLISDQTQVLNGFQVTTFSIRISLHILALILLINASNTISEEIYSGTALNILIRFYHRRDFLFGKFIFLFFSALALMASMLIVGFILGHILGGLHPLQEGEYLIYSSGTLFVNIIISMAFVVLPFTTLIALGLFISVVVKNPGAAVGTGIVTYLVFYMLSQIEQMQDKIFTYYLSLSVDKISRMTEGIYIDWETEMLKSICIPIIYCMLFIFGGIYIFNKKDI